MCLIGFAWQTSAEFPFALIANRDEFHARPTQHLRWWSDQPIAAGRDLQAGGTWLGLNKLGRFAALTNYREGGVEPSGPLESRGNLVTKVLNSTDTLAQLQNNIEQHQMQYGGYNLLFGDLFGEHRELMFTSNRSDESFTIKPGVYAFSNGPFETQWPKSATVHEQLTRALRHRKPQEFWSILANQERPDPGTLPDTGVGSDVEEFLSSIFIVGEDYGTRSSNLLLCRNHQEIEMSERRFDTSGELTGVSHLHIRSKE